MRNDSNYIRTFTGKKFYPLDPQPEDVDIIDIAHALSNVCRFSGHLSEFYSVGHHSVILAGEVPLSDALAGLIHDASEAYIADIARPIKHQPEFEFYRKVEDRLMAVILARFGLSPNLPESVKIADKRMLVTEMRDLSSAGSFNSERYEVAVNSGIKPYSFKINPEPPKQVKEWFLDKFDDYSKWRTDAAGR